MLLVGALLSWIPIAIVGLLAVLLSLLGAILVILGRKVFGSRHRRNVIVSIILFFLGYFVVFVGGIAAGVGAATALSSPATEEELAAVLRNVMTNMLVLVAIGSVLGGLSSVFFTYALQKAEGWILLWAAYAATVGIQIAILIVTISEVSSIAAVMANEVSTGNALAPSEIAIVVSARVGGFWPLSVIPSFLYAGANYLAWNRISQREIPPLAIPAAAPLTRLPPTPTGGPIPSHMATSPPKPPSTTSFSPSGQSWPLPASGLSPERTPSRVSEGVDYGGGNQPQGSTVPTGIEITCHRRFGQFLITNQPSLTVGPSEVTQLRWGTPVFVPLSAGVKHQLVIQFPYMRGVYGVAEFSVELREGELQTFVYRTPFIVYSRGTLTRTT